VLHIYQNVSENCIAIPNPRYSTVVSWRRDANPLDGCLVVGLTTASLQTALNAFPRILPKRLYLTATTVATEMIRTNRKYFS
jgi:hypothetical protein